MHHGRLCGSPLDVPRAKGEANEDALYLPQSLLALIVVLLLATSVRSQNQAAVMPGPGWQVIKADCGSGNRWETPFAFREDSLDSNARGPSGRL